MGTKVTIILQLGQLSSVKVLDVFSVCEQHLFTHVTAGFGQELPCHISSNVKNWALVTFCRHAGSMIWCSFLQVVHCDFSTAKIISNQLM